MQPKQKTSFTMWVHLSGGGLTSNPIHQVLHSYHVVGGELKGVQFGISEELKMANQELEPEGFCLFPVGLLKSIT